MIRAYEWGRLGMGVVGSLAVAGCFLFSGPSLERSPRTADKVGVVASVSDDRRTIGLEDGTTVTVDDPNQFINGNSVPIGSLLFAGSSPTPWRAVLDRHSYCPSAAPYSSDAVAWSGDTYVDFYFGLRVPQAPGFGLHGEPIKSGTELNGPVCVDPQGRAVDYLGGGV